MAYPEDMQPKTPSTVVPPSMDELKTRLPEYCRSHGITRMEVFGSVALAARV